MQVTRNANGTYTLTPTAAEAATLARLAARFPPQTSETLLQELVAGWVKGHADTFTEATLTKFHQLSAKDQARVRAILDTAS